MSYTVNEETIRLNEEATRLNVQVGKVRKEANDLWIKLQQDLHHHQELMMRLGSLTFQQVKVEEELRKAVEQG